MNIIRDYAGCKVEIRLTEDELHQAYREQEYLFDLDSCDNHFELMFCYESWYDFVDCESRKRIVEAAATELRRNIDKYDLSWGFAMEEAFRCQEVREMIDQIKRGASK